MMEEIQAQGFSRGAESELSQVNILDTIKSQDVQIGGTDSKLS